MRSIKKEIKKTVIEAEKIFYLNGELKAERLEALEVLGESVKPEKAVKLLREKYGDADTLMVKSITETVTVYRISAEDFMKHAHIETAEESTETAE